LVFFVRVLLPLYSFTVICFQSAPILLAYGRFDIQFWCVVGLSVGRVFAVLLGLWIGLTGMLYAIVAVTMIFCVIMLIVPAEITGSKPLPMLAGLVSPLISSVAAVGVFFLLIRENPTSVIWTATSLIVGLLAYTICMLLIDQKNLVDDWTGIRRILSRRELA